MRVSKRPTESGLYIVKPVRKKRGKAKRLIVNLIAPGGQITEIETLGSTFSAYIADFEEQWVGPFTVDQLLAALIRKAKQ